MCACVCVYVLAYFSSKIHRLLTRLCYQLPAVKDRMCNRNRSVDFMTSSCCAHHLCWHFEGSFYLALFSHWCQYYIEDSANDEGNVSMKISPHPSRLSFTTFDNIIFFPFSFSKCFILPHPQMLLRGSDLLSGEDPSRSCLARRTHLHRMVWWRRGLLFLLIIPSDFTKTPSFRGFSPYPHLKGFLMNV